MTLQELHALIEANWGPDNNVNDPTYHGSFAQTFTLYARVAMAALKNGQRTIAKGMVQRLVSLAYRQGEPAFLDATGVVNQFLTELNAAVCRMS